MITRQQLLNKEVTHEEYYADVVRSIGYEVGPRLVSLATKALKLGQRHVPGELHLWDMQARLDANRVGPELLRRGSTGWSLSEGVCVAKQAAIIQAEQLKHTTHEHKAEQV